MPRLVGKKANPMVWVLPLVAIAAIGAIAQLEYTGVLDVMPEFGRSSVDQSN